MIVVNARPWVPIKEITHATSSWKIATDETMLDIIEEIERSDKYINILYSNVFIPQEYTYWVSMQRHLSDDTDMPWSEPQPVTGTYVSNAVLNINDIHVDTPSIIIEEAEIIDPNNDSISILTSDFSGVGDGHFATHYIVLDADGEVVVTSIEDEVNLAGIVLSKSAINFTQLTALDIRAIHVTATGCMSGVGRMYIDFRNINYRIINNLAVPVDSEVDLIISMTKVNTELKSRITGYKLMKDGEILYYTATSGDITSIVIDKQYLQESSMYDLVIHSLVNNTTIDKKYSITTI